MLRRVLLAIGFGSIATLHASIFSLTPSEQLFVSLSNNLVVNNVSAIQGDVGLAGTGAMLSIQSTASIQALSPYTGAADFSGAVKDRKSVV